MVQGLYAASATPVDAQGRPDLPTFDRLVDVLMDGGLDGVCVSGSTGEYPCFTVDERAGLFHRAASRLPPGKRLIAGVGAASARDTIALGRAAMSAGAAALLVPPPFFVRYEQHDLAAFFRFVGSTLQTPCLLYDVPHVTTPIATGTMIELLRSERWIVGVKDSSGQAPRVEELPAARGGASWCLLTGDEMLLAQAVERGWNGGISGIATFCPELVVGLYRCALGGDRAGVARWQLRLAELLEQIAHLPGAWFARVGLRVRGLDVGPPPVPASPIRTDQVAAFEPWLRGWLVRAGVPVALRP